MIVTKASTEVRVFAPATVANVAVGFDILGFALDAPGDEVVVRSSAKPGLRITAITGTQGKQLPFEVEKNTAGFAALQLLDHLGETQRGVEMEIHKKMPFGSGLGSSAASAAAAVTAVNELLGRPLDKIHLLPFAVAGEQVADGAYHADNVGPSLLGGMILIRNNQSLDVHRLPVPANLFASVVYPAVEILTKDARSILSDSVELKKHILQSGNLAAFIVSLYQADFGLMSRCLKDVIIEPQRARLIPCFQQVKETALSAGALGCSISGAGPSIFALSQGRKQAEEIGTAMQGVFGDAGIACDIYISPINQEGAKKI